MIPTDEGWWCGVRRETTRVLGRAVVEEGESDQIQILGWREQLRRWLSVVLYHGLSI